MGLGSGNVFDIIFGLGQVGDFDFGSVRVRVSFYWDIRHFFPRISRINLELKEKHALHPELYFMMLLFHFRA